MAKGRKTYPREYRERLVELYRAGRSAESLAKDFEPTAQSIRNWVKQADLDEGRRQDGLTTAERAGVRPMRIHDLRHAFVTYLLALGEDLKTIQELARHSSIYVTMNTYAHVMPAAKCGAVDKLGGILGDGMDSE